MVHKMRVYSTNRYNVEREREREKENEREKYNDINVSALFLLHTYAQKKLLGIRFICDGKVVSYAWRPYNMTGLYFSLSSLHAET